LTNHKAITKSNHKLLTKQSQTDHKLVTNSKLITKQSQANHRQVTSNVSFGSGWRKLARVERRELGLVSRA
jgi:predicted house-cleaning NTP pyrophosphatase (Maf/HAM1 superfamily)